MMLALAHLKRGELKAARAAADAAKELRQGDAEALRVDAKVLTAEGDHAAAASAYATVVEATPEDAQSRLLLARELVRSGEAKAALPHLERLAQDLPEEAVVWSEWGGALIQLGTIDGPEGALARLDRALELRAELVSAQLWRVEALTALGRCKEAAVGHRELVAAKPAAKAQADEALGACGRRSKR